MLQEILRLKKTLSPKTLGPFNYKEIGERLGLTKQGVHHHVKKLLKDKDKPVCPSCLQPIEKHATTKNDNTSPNILP